MTEYTAKRARTRGQLLAAGQELLPGAVRRGLEHALGPGPVTQRAELSRQTWYRYWRADDSAYLDELLAVALDTVTFLLGPRLAVLSQGAGDGREAAEALIRAHFTMVTQRRIAIPHLVGVVLALEDRHLEAEEGTRPTSAPEIVREYQNRVHDALEDAYGALLNGWGRRPGGTGLARIVDLVTALADGFALRQVVDPEGASEDEFAQTAVGLLEALTEPVAGEPPNPRPRP
jgi:hypothetical protein